MGKRKRHAPPPKDERGALIARAQTLIGMRLKHTDDLTNNALRNFIRDMERAIKQRKHSHI